MWIRSQNKLMLMQIHEVHVTGGVINALFCGTTNLGTYKTPERAMEVLNDIQSEIMNCNPVNDVYIMPKE